jgi:hypothetical protein
MRLINLLPKPRQYELRYDAMLRGLWVFITMSIFSFALVFLAQLGTKFYLQMEANVFASEISELQGQVSKRENADLKTKIKAVNDIVADFNNLSSSSPKWSKVVAAFAPLPPPGTRISSMVIDSNKKAIAITGYANTREDVIQLYNNILNDSADFYNVDYPLENVLKPTNINFHFNFSIQDKLLH